jgi:hypothetical protein
MAGDRPTSDPSSRILGPEAANQTYILNSRTAPAGYRPSLTSSSSPGGTLAGGMVCIFKDVNPWSLTSTEAILTAHGIPYEVHTSSEFASLNFSQFEMIVFSSDQTQSFYDAYAANQGKFTSYVTGGGFLLFSACDSGWNLGTLSAPLPGGMSTVHSSVYYNTIVDPTHPVVGCVPNPIYGSYASHAYFTDVPAGADVIAEALNTPDVRQNPPTLLEYHMGYGTMLASTLTLEFGYVFGQDAGIVLENALLYGYGLPTCTSFDLIYVDEFGRSKLCVNSQTGDFSYKVLKGSGIGEYTGQAYLSMRNGVLFINSTTLSPRLTFYDNQKFHKAYGSYTQGTLRSYLDDRNTADDPVTCNQAIIDE